MNNLSFTVIAITAMSMIISDTVVAADHVVDQSAKKFSVSTLSVKVGDSVSFKNADPFFHNIFSLSDAAIFDLGSYPSGESRSVTLDEPGIVDVECAIHPSMKMTIEVTQ